jgi:hypothetical protein
MNSHVEQAQLSYARHNFFRYFGLPRIRLPISECPTRATCHAYLILLYLIIIIIIGEGYKLTLCK